ncbi:MAG: glycosyltransferase [Thermodesulfobacteriota bacterium]
MVRSEDSGQRKKLLIVCQNQFGYHVDAYYYCKYLQQRFEITYICWDYQFKRIDLDGVEVILVSRKGTVLRRYLRYLASVVFRIRKGRYDIHFIKYFRACALLRICAPSKPFVLDVRSGHISNRKIIRQIFDCAIRIESLFFRNLTVISQGLAKKLYLDNKAVVLPLGAEELSASDKKFDRLHLLYVGTLSERNIEQTLLGFIKFIEEFNKEVDIRYTIIGSGAHGEEDVLRRIVEEKKLSSVVSVLGRIPHDQLAPYFASHTVGVSYVPLTEYFDVQPVTKTYEYLLSGMPVLATKTTENARIIGENNGVLIDDDQYSFCEGLKRIHQRLGRFDSGRIRQSACEYRWRVIVAGLEEYLFSLSDSGRKKFAIGACHER